jgi:hypothetical protein
LDSIYPKFLQFADQNKEVNDSAIHILMESNRIQSNILI